MCDRQRSNGAWYRAQGGFLRPIHKVIEAVQKLTPEDFPERADFFHELDEITESAAYSAPELLKLQWDRFVQALEQHLGKGDEPWKLAIKDVMSTKTDYRTVIGE
jgi:hypothetical protein